MDWDVKLDGASIRGEVASFTLHKGRSLFCKDVSIVLNDRDRYASFDFAQVPEATRLEVLTEVGGEWLSEGEFFVERPDAVQDKDGITVPSLWGRDVSARLTYPFAVRISKEWDEETTLLGILQEIIEGAGLEYDASRMLVNDYTIYGGSFSAANRYPIEILQELVGKTDGFLQTDRQGRLWVLRDLYHWDSVGDEIHGGMIMSLTERVEFPQFANRVRVGSYGRDGDANLNISLAMSAASVAIGETITGRAVVTHNDGTPAADGHAVEWTTDDSSYATWQSATTHTGTVRVTGEIQTASNSLYMVSALYPIRQVYSVTEISTGTTKAVRSFSGRSIVLDEALTFTDSGVTIDYEAGGIADNTLVPGSTGEVEVDVHAIVAEYIRDTATVRIDTESGDETGDQAMYVTLVYKDFITDELLEGVAPVVDGQSRADSDENGEVDLGLMAGGSHTHSATKSGYQGTEDDGLANDSFRCSTS